MITKKGLIIIITAFVCLVSIFFVSPYTEQYEGITGYKYEHGLELHILMITLFIVSILLFVYAFTDMYEVES